jgi:hypothetical protein
MIPFSENKLKFRKNKQKMADYEKLILLVALLSSCAPFLEAQITQDQMYRAVKSPNVTLGSLPDLNNVKTDLDQLLTTLFKLNNETSNSTKSIQFTRMENEPTFGTQVVLV